MQLFSSDSLRVIFQTGCIREMIKVERRCFGKEKQDDLTYDFGPRVQGTGAPGLNRKRTRHWW